MSIPGTGASVATTFDGPGLTKKGKGRKALEIALFASVFGDTSSDVITILAIAPIALIALQIGPPELGAVLFLSLIVLAATANGSFVKGMVMLVLGLFLAIIGQAQVNAWIGFAFGDFALRPGIPRLPVLFGLFA